MQRIRVKGSGLDAAPGEPPSDELLLDQFATSLASVVDRLCRNDGEANIFAACFDGILILVDEADNRTPELSLGSFLKLVVERLQRKGCSRVLIGLAGLPELRTRLHESHPSSLRMFQELQLGRLSNKEVNRVIDICLDQANAGAIAQTTITKAGRSMLVGLSEGFPSFIQQFGFSAFAFDGDGRRAIEAGGVWLDASL